jgi:hypothetical protein
MAHISVFFSYVINLNNYGPWGHGWGSFPLITYYYDDSGPPVTWRRQNPGLMFFLSFPLRLGSKIRVVQLIYWKVCIYIHIHMYVYVIIYIYTLWIYNIISYHINTIIFTYIKQIWSIYLYTMSNMIYNGIQSIIGNQIG